MMPHSSKKDRASRSSRWHDFHFSGKVIICSVLLGFMLILVGGILVAIGMDREDGDLKTDDYEDIQRKPPMGYVGPVLMGIGGFAVLVGVFMCLFETNVCRKRNPDSRPLISNDGEETAVKTLDSGRKESGATAIPPRHQRGHQKKFPRRTQKKSTKDRAKKASPESPIPSSSHLTTSDKFMTPPCSFQENFETAQSSTKKKLEKSFTSSGPSWNVSSTEFQTPVASFTDNSLEFQQSSESQESGSTPTAEMGTHGFVTPTSSDADKLDIRKINESAQISVKVKEHDEQKVHTSMVLGTTTESDDSDDSERLTQSCSDKNAAERNEHQETLNAIDEDSSKLFNKNPIEMNSQDSVAPINDYAVEVVKIEPECSVDQQLGTEELPADVKNNETDELPEKILNYSEKKGSKSGETCVEESKETSTKDRIETSIQSRGETLVTEAEAKVAMNELEGINQDRQS